MINYFSESTDFLFLDQEKSNNWVEAVLLKESKTLGEINYIFCSDEYLLKMNQAYLNHDTFTDIITFNYVINNKISGDLFISIDRIKENALATNTSFYDELNRVMIHGVLHLIGYDDKSLSDAQEIRAKEDFYLALRC